MAATQRTKSGKNVAVSKQSGRSAALIDPQMPLMPIIDGESERDYLAFRASCLGAIKPKDAIEEVWMNDFASYSWEANRLQRMKGALIQSTRRAAVEAIFSEYLPGKSYENRDRAGELSKIWSSYEEETVEYVKEFLAEHDLDLDTIMATAVSLKLKELEQIDKLISSYEYRRDAALRELEKRRDLLARRIRENAATDVEFEEQQAAE